MQINCAFKYSALVLSFVVQLGGPLTIIQFLLTVQNENHRAQSKYNFLHWYFINVTFTMYVN